MDISRKDARKLFLHQQGLLRGDSFGRGHKGLLCALQRLSYLQIDTISVVDRAHIHIATTRVSDFKPAHLDRLMAERQVFEYWSHAASFIPIDHYRYSLPVMRGWKTSRSRDRKLAKKILDRIRAEGPLQSRDFEDSRENKTSGWWDWKPAKQMLEYLFLSGELMVTARTGFQKVFDVPDRVIPDHIDTTEPTIDEWADSIVRRQVDALGVASEYDISYARPSIWRLARINLKEPIRYSIERQVEAGTLLPVQIEGRDAYTTSELLDQLPLRATRGAVRILSPFDNLVINRRRSQELFDFDYQLECYVPAAKRQYGYFSLPLLYGDELIGRMDAKADRKSHRLLVNNLAIEDGVKCDDRLINSLADGIVEFAQRHHTDRIELNKLQPARIRSALSAKLEAGL